MDKEQFIMWLHGYFEIANPKTIGEKETQIIRDHLEIFFKKVTPNRTEEVEELIPTPTSTEIKLSDISETIKEEDCGFRGNVVDTIYHRNTCQICSKKYGLGLQTPLQLPPSRLITC